MDKVLMHEDEHSRASSLSFPPQSVRPKVPLTSTIIFTLYGNILSSNGSENYVSLMLHFEGNSGRQSSDFESRRRGRDSAGPFSYPALLRNFVQKI